MSVSDLAQVVVKATDRRIPSKVFISLVSQITRRRSVLDAEVEASMLDIVTNDANTQVKLVLEWAFSDNARLTQILRCLPQATWLTQTHYLRALPNSVPLAAKHLFLNELYPSYLKAVVDRLQTSSNTSEIGKFLITLIFVTDHFYSNDGLAPSGELTQQLKDIGHKLVTYADKHDLGEVATMINLFLHRQPLGKSSANDALTPNTLGSSLTTKMSKGSLIFKMSPERQLRRYRSSSFYWLLINMKQVRTTTTPQGFLQEYLNQFIEPLQHKDGTYIATELIRSNFVGILFCILNNESRYLIFNWKNFITLRLPKILALLSVDLLEPIIILVFSKLGEPALSVLGSMVIGKARQYDLRQAFVKGCVLSKLLLIHLFQKIFPLEKNQSLVSELGQTNVDFNFSSKFDETLLQTNPEFTLLEELGLFEFMDSLVVPLEFLVSRQLDFSSTVIRVIDELIEKRDNARLFRLLVLLFHNINVLNLVVYNCTPRALINKLIDYLDRDSFNFEDEENFQEHYLYFGVILVAVIAMVELFHLDMSHFVVKGSFVMDYLNNFYFRLCDNMLDRVAVAKPDEDDQIILTNYNQLFNNWVNALFDDSNDGLLDDLIKSILVKQIYQLIPILYQQAIIAGHTGQLTFAVLNNGIDYLSQGFLIPATVSIINWLLKMITLDGTNDLLYIDVLNALFQSNLQDVDTLKYIFKLVITVTGSNVLQTLKLVTDWEKLNKIKNLINSITQYLDLSYIDNHLSFKQEIETGSILAQQFRNLMMYTMINDTMSLVPLNITFLWTYLETNCGAIVETMVDEMALFLKNNSDDSKTYINVGIYLLVVTSVYLAEDKQHWLEVLLLPPPREDDTKMIEDDPSSNKQKFSLEMDRHYSLIFNEKKPDDDDMFDMMEDDGLFNELKKRIPTLECLSKLQKLRQRQVNSLAALQELRIQSLTNNGNHKALGLFVERVIDQLNNFYI